MGMRWLGEVAGLPSDSPSVLNTQQCSPASKTSGLRAHPTERRLRLPHGAPVSKGGFWDNALPMAPSEPVHTMSHLPLWTPQQEGEAKHSQRRQWGRPLIESVLTPSARDELNRPT